METHRKLTFLGLFLLLITFGINYHYEQDPIRMEFNYAFITGIAMMITFMVSFTMFNVNRWKGSKTSKS